MVYQAYTLYDVKAQLYHPPFFTHNHALAQRMVADVAADLNTQVGRHPSDFKLYYIGGYDDGAGRLVPLSIMEHVCDVIALVAPPAPSIFDAPKGIDPKWWRENVEQPNGEAK